MILRRTFDIGGFAAAMLLMSAIMSLAEWSAGAPSTVFFCVRPVPALIGITVLGLTSAREAQRNRLPRWSRGLLPGVVAGYLVGFALVESAIRWVYARPFRPRVDIPMIDSLLRLTLGPIGRAADVAAPFVIALGFLVSFGVGIALVRIMMTGAGAIRRRRIAAFVIAGASAVSVSAGGTWAHLDFPLRTVTAWADSGRLQIRSVPPPAEIPAPEDVYAFPGILDRSIFMFAVEAYGYATVSNPSVREGIAAARTDLYAALRQNGYQVATTYLRSPVAGGFSWLAEATLLTGQWIDSQTAFEGLYGSDLPTLTGAFQRAGYHTFSVRPGTVHDSWPEGWELFRFERSLVAYDGDFGYEGPWFSYVPVTDQFAIWRAHQYLQEARSGETIGPDRPFLGYYQLVSSHTPFNAIPPIIGDWNELDQGRVYRARFKEIERFDNTWTGGNELVAGYNAAISHVLRVLAKYVREQMVHSEKPVILVFGDHQPQRPIRERDAHLSVPVHLAARESVTLERAIAAGFQPGMVSSEPPPHRDMSDFFSIFLEIAGRAGAREQSQGSHDGGSASSQ